MPRLVGVCDGLSLILFATVLRFIPECRHFQIQCWFVRTARYPSQSQWRCSSERRRTTHSPEALPCYQTDPESQERTSGTLNILKTQSVLFDSYCIKTADLKTVSSFFFHSRRIKFINAFTVLYAA